MSDAGDDYFGPQVNGYFDFTVLFEHSILSILPTALFILLAPCRIAWLLRQKDVHVRSGKLLWVKLVRLHREEQNLRNLTPENTGRHRSLLLPPNHSRSAMGSPLDPGPAHIGRRGRPGPRRSRRPRRAVVH